ncbi:hypothetical protein HN873_050017 [Arachis hypogaea]
MEKSKARSGGGGDGGGGAVNGGGGDLNSVFNQDRGTNTIVSVPNGNYKTQGQQMVVNNDGYIGINAVRNGENCGESYKREMRDLEELLSKLNPMVEDFVPPSFANSHGYLAGPGGATGFGFANNFAMLMEVVQFCEKYNLVQFQELFKEEGVVEHGMFLNNRKNI